MTGAALPLFLLVLLVLTGAAHGALLLALEELRGSRAAARLLRVRVEAESAVERARSTIVSEEGGWAGEGRIGTGSLNQGVSHEIVLAPLSLEFALLEGRSRAGTGSGGTGPAWRVGRLHWKLDPLEELRRSGAAIEHVGALRVTGEAEIEVGADGAGDGDVAGGSCQMATSTPVSRPRLEPGEGDPPFPFLGILSVPEAVAAFRGAEVGLVRLDDAGESVRQPVATGDVEIAGGEWEGVLVVDGSVVVSRDARVRGLLVVTADLELEGDARFDGTVRAGGDVRLRDRARLGADPCLALAAFERAEGLTRPIPVPGGSWLHPL